MRDIKRKSSGNAIANTLIYKKGSSKYSDFIESLSAEARKEGFSHFFMSPSHIASIVTRIDDFVKAGVKTPEDVDKAYLKYAKDVEEYASKTSKLKSTGS